MTSSTAPPDPTAAAHDGRLAALARDLARAPDAAAVERVVADHARAAAGAARADVTADPTDAGPGALVVALESGGERVGALVVQWEPHRDPAPGEREVLRALADVAAAALHRARLAFRRRAEDARAGLLGAVSVELDQTLGTDERLRRLMQLLVPDLADLATVRIREPDGSRSRLAAVAHRDPALERVAARLYGRWTAGPEVSGPERVIETGTPELIAGITDEMWTAWAPDAEALADVRALGNRSWLCVPLAARGQVIGALSLQRRPGGAPYDAGMVALAEEIGRRAGLAIENARLFEGERAMRAAVERARAREELLRRVTAALSRAVTAEEVADVIVVDCMAALGATAGAVAVHEAGAATVIAARGYPEEALRVGARVPPDARMPLPWVLRAGEARWLETRDDWLRDFDAPSSRLGPVGVALPLIVEGRVIGAIAFRFDGAERRFTDAEHRLVETLAELCAQALDRARLFDDQRSAAELLQRRLLPASLPDLPGIEVAVRYLPAAEGLAGGDFYDCVVREDGVVGVIVGDVVGHGVEAASAMGQLRSSWRILQQMRVTPGRALVQLDRFAGDVEGAAAATAACLDVLADGTVGYACAGHPPPLLVPAGSPARFLMDGRGPPLGMGLYRLAAGIAPFGPGDLLLLYTDGVVERRTAGIDRGLDRLRELAEASAGLPLERLLDAVVAGTSPETADDRALLALRRAG
jgi:GAF domain-containing protein